MLINNWLKALTVSASRRDRRRGRGANRQAWQSRDMLNCGAFVETLEIKTLLSATPELVADLVLGAGGSNPSNFVNVNGTLFFSANDGTNGYELWQSDGTAAGTTLVHDILSGSSSSYPGSLTNVNGTLFFRANDGTNGSELWQSDGTAAGTTLVHDIRSGSSSSFPNSLTNVNGTLFFSADDGTNGRELWSMVPNSVPIALPSNITTEEDTTATFLVSEFLFTDLESDSLVSIGVSNLTLAGGDTLTVDQGSGAVVVTNGMTILAAEIPSLTYTPAGDASGVARSTFDFTVNDANPGTVAATMTINVTAIADAPSVTNASTSVNVQSTSGLVITVNPVDGAEVTHFKITSITGGTLFQNDGTTPINSGDFVTVADGGLGLKFTPSTDFMGTGHFTIQASTSNVDGGLGGSTVTADITVMGLTLGDTIWIDGNGNRTFESGTDIASGIVTLTLFQGDGTTVVTTGTTDANGKYEFTNLLPGDYVVRVDASNFGSGLPLAGLISVSGSTDPDNNINKDDNGVDDADPATNGIRSLPITLALGAEPTGAGNNTNWSLDFGFALPTPGLNPIPGTLGVRPTLTWQPVPGATHYEIWFSRTFPVATRVELDSNVVGTSWTPPADLQSGYYRYWVRGLDAAGHSSGWSAFNVFQVRPILISPLAGTFTDRPTFNWQAIPGASSYQLTIRSGSGDQLIQNISTNSYTPPADLPAGPIQWWARATGAPQNSGWSYSGHLNRTPQSKVTGPASPASATPQITWSVVPGAGRYILHVENTATPGIAVIRKDDLTTTDFTPTTPLPAGSYRAWIKAIDATSNAFSSGLWSRRFDFTVAMIDAEATEDLLNPDSGITLTSLPKQLQPVVQGDSAQDNNGSDNSALQTADVDMPQAPVTIDAAIAVVADEELESEMLDAVMGQAILMASMLD